MHARPFLLGLLWTSVTLALTVTTWLAVSLVAEQVGGSTTQVLSADAVVSAAASPQPSTEPAPGRSPTKSPSHSPRPSSSPTHHPSSSAHASSSAHPTHSSSAKPTATHSGGGSTTQSRTFAVSGGTVAASCTGNAVSLRSAQPADGWRVEVKDRGPEHIEVSFRSGEQETEVKVVCSGGVPVVEVDDGEDDGSAEE